MIQASDLEVRPDEKGPKNLAILLLLSSLIVAGMGWQDWQLHNDGLSDDQIETFLATPNSQPGEPTTVEQYRDFEADVRCLLYTSPSPRDQRGSRMPSSA